MLLNFLAKNKDPVAYLKEAHTKKRVETGIEAYCNFFIVIFFKHLTSMISFIQQMLKKELVFMNCLGKKPRTSMVLLSEFGGVA